METPPPETEMVLLGTHRFVVSVHTGDHKGDDIKANDIRSNVYIQLCDAVGFSTPAYHLPFVGDVQQWSVSRYALPDEPMLTDIDNILLRRDEADIGDAWLIYLVEVDDRQYQRKYVFPVHRWLEVDTAYRLRQYDMSLPQDDDPGMVTSRRLETVIKRKHYVYAQFIGDGPATIKDMPDEEYFSFMDEYWFEKEVKLLRRQRTPDALSTDKWTSFTEMMESCRKTYGETIAMEHWNTDRWFGVQRLQGVNAGLITLCTTIPDKLGVDVGMMSPFLEGFTLDEAIKRSRIFMVDLHILDGISPVEGSSKHLCSPIALFFLNKAGHLMPVAIQLFQKATHHNPVFLPSDPPNLWLLAKMFYNNAEAQHHQACTNLGLTRLLMEGVVVCTNRNLGPSHPLFRLLAPHFLYLVAINEATVIQLLKTGSWLFKLLTAGEGGLQELIKRGLQGWRLDTCGVVPRQVAGRGVADDTVLPYYPYRDDACALYAAIERYVRTVVYSVYTDPLRILADCELLQWRRELTRPRHEGGVGLLGVPGSHQIGFSSAVEVVEVVTVFIATCSLGHAAASHPQYDECGFVPNYPLVLHGSAPRTKDREPSEAELMRYLPGRDVTWEIITLTKLLSQHDTACLGDFKVRYLYDPVSMRAAEELRAELRQLTKKITERNATAAFPYPWLDPAIVPNSISR